MSITIWMMSNVDDPQVSKRQFSNVHKYSKVCITMTTAAEIVNKSSPVVSIAADVPLVFSTVQLYVPKTLVTLWAMVSTVSYVPLVALITTCVCWYVALRVITPPSFLQVTLVAGPPVEVQVRDLVVSLYTSVVVVGVPETKEPWNGLYSRNKLNRICVNALI